MTRLRAYSLSLVKEDSVLYEYDNINSPERAANAVRHLFKLDTSPVEKFIAVALNTKNKPIGAVLISTGTLNQTLVHPREVFQALLQIPLTAGFIVAHNHPSNVPDPSHEDLILTKRLIECGELIGIKLVDSLIITENNHYSMKAHGDLSF